MDDEDGDSDAGASEHVCSPGNAMRSPPQMPQEHLFMSDADARQIQSWLIKKTN